MNSQKTDLYIAQVAIQIAGMSSIAYTVWSPPSTFDGIISIGPESVDFLDSTCPVLILSHS